MFFIISWKNTHRFGVLAVVNMNVLQTCKSRNAFRRRPDEVTSEASSENFYPSIYWLVFRDTLKIR